MSASANKTLLKEGKQIFSQCEIAHRISSGYFMTELNFRHLGSWFSIKGGGGSGLSLWKKLFRVRSWRGRPGHVLTF